MQGEVSGYSSSVQYLTTSRKDLESGKLERYKLKMGSPTSSISLIRQSTNSADDNYSVDTGPSTYPRLKLTLTSSNLRRRRIPPQPITRQYQTFTRSLQRLSRSPIPKHPGKRLVDYGVYWVETS